MLILYFNLFPLFIQKVFQYLKARIYLSVKAHNTVYRLKKHSPRLKQQLILFPQVILLDYFE